jgi:flagellar hook assembly protein FlgD
LEVYNVKGQLVRTLLNDVKAAGNHTVVWNGKDNNGRSVSSGIYYYKMNTGKYSSTKKMIMMK